MLRKLTAFTKQLLGQLVQPLKAGPCSPVTNIIEDWLRAHVYTCKHACRIPSMVTLFVNMQSCSSSDHEHSQDVIATWMQYSSTAQRERVQKRIKRIEVKMLWNRSEDVMVRCGGSVMKNNLQSKKKKKIKKDTESFAISWLNRGVQGKGLHHEFCNSKTSGWESSLKNTFVSLSYEFK